MDISNKGTVRQYVTTHTVKDGRPRRTRDTILSFSKDTPLAVALSFEGEIDELSWVFARSIIAAGLRRPTGKGLVFFAPTSRQDLCELVLKRQGTRHSSRLLLHRPDVENFIARTDRVVPCGSESVDVDTLISGLLGEGS